MAKCRAFLTREDQHGQPGYSRLAANDEPVVPLGRDTPPLTLPETATLAPCPANDDWIEEDLPVSINVLAEEVVLLDLHLRANILALFD